MYLWSRLSSLARSLGINFFALVHFLDEVSLSSSLKRETAPVGTDASKVVVLSHGWSQVVGPDYPLVRTLEIVAKRRGWKVVVPDFRPSYRYKSARGRSERVSVLLTELLCLRPRARTVVLAGHSQGGAASSLVCSPRVVEAAHIRGLFVAGAESARHLDGMTWVPPVPHVQLVHAERDGVIGASHLQAQAKAWDVPLTLLHSAVEYGSRDCWGDDIHHDFLSKELMEGVVHHFGAFLDRVSVDHAASAAPPGQCDTDTPLPISSVYSLLGELDAEAVRSATDEEGKLSPRERDTTLSPHAAASSSS
jgi:hypothetical protein